MSGVQGGEDKVQLDKISCILAVIFRRHFDYIFK